MMGRASQGEQWQCWTESSTWAMPTKAVLVLSSPAVTLVAIEIEAEILGSLLRHRAGKQTPTEGLQNPLLRTLLFDVEMCPLPLLLKFNHEQTCFNNLKLTPRLFRKRSKS